MNTARRAGTVAMISMVAMMLGGTALALRAETTPAPLHERCAIEPSDEAGKFRLSVDRDDCGDRRWCGSNSFQNSFTGLTGITESDFSREGAHLTATFAAEAGTFVCAGTVFDGELRGDATFTPDAEFVDRMAQMGFRGYDAEKLMANAFIGVGSAWARSIKDTGIGGITIDNLLALRIFKVTPEYIRGFTSLGYELPDADKVVALSVQKVDPEEVRQIRALGYQPTLDELIQIRIFKITPDFIRSMQARGFHNLTIAKLVQMKIFKLDE
ncbi:MAG TPA: hypothetical protein VL967_15685 [Terracidiphilus sp.]|nr:hypothetical protein [Terracidiphilus sp.]